MTGTWHLVSKHLFRRTAYWNKGRLERLQAQAASGTGDGVESSIELRELAIPLEAQLRVAPRRYKGFWRVELLA